MPSSPSGEPADFSGFGTDAMTPAAPTPTPAAQAPALPKPPKITAPRPTIKAPVTPEGEPGPRSIDDVEPSQALDKPALQEKPPPAGDEQMEFDPTSDFPIPSTPYQGTPDDDQMNGPLFSNGVRKASLPSGDVQSAIAAAARANGIDPAYALATAERESSFNPNSGGTGTINGLYQFTAANRAKYGQADGADVGEQTRAFGGLTTDNRAALAQRLGREPTWPETYLAHYWGAGRAARVLSMDPQTPVRDVFTPRELLGNPNLLRAGTVGNAAGSILSDMQRRMGRYSGATPQSAEPGMDPNLTVAQQQATADAQIPSMMKGFIQPNQQIWDAAVATMPESEHVQDRRDEAPGARRDRENDKTMRDFTGQTANDRVQEDFSQFGGNLAKDAGIDSMDRLPAFQNKPQPGRRKPMSPTSLMPSIDDGPLPRPFIGPEPGRYNTNLGDDEPAFRQWVKDKKVPFDVDAKTSDYDMRGFYKALQAGDPRAKSAIDPNDDRMHYPDVWKTPHHETFSADSQWADDTAPKWTPDDKLTSPSGRVLYDDRKKKDGLPDFSNFGAAQ